VERERCLQSFQMYSYQIKLSNSLQSHCHTPALWKRTVCLLPMTTVSCQSSSHT
jgi:hypothetical protein